MSGGVAAAVNWLMNPWRSPKEAESPRARRPARTWQLSADHGLTERARILAEIAFADFANDRLGITDRAAFRIAEALEKYDTLDRAAEQVEGRPGE